MKSFFWLPEKERANLEAELAGQSVTGAAVPPKA
jgi:hypothetical protein